MRLDCRPAYATRPPQLLVADSNGGVTYQALYIDTVAPGMIYEGNQHIIGYDAPVSQVPEWVKVSFVTSANGLVTQETLIDLPPVETIRSIDTQNGYENYNWWWDE